MYLACVDLEGVFSPEIWEFVSEKTGIKELRLTTKDEPDYDKLMNFRLTLLKKYKITLTEIQNMVESNKITFGHARALLGIEDQKEKIQLAQRIIKESITVREVEKIIHDKNSKTDSLKVEKISQKKSNENLNVEGSEEKIIEEDLTRHLATKVKVGLRKITIEYYGNEDLHRLYTLITGKEEPF